MIRHGKLWEQIIRFENLLQAARQAQKGKRFRGNVLEFNYNLETKLLQLQHELQTRTYKPGDYRTFQIREPKLRLVSAAPYRDRVVHHALCAIVMPIFERTFIHDSYANRIGKGTHCALHRFVKFARSNQYVLQSDIRKYFPSIDRTILKTLLRRKVKCPETLWLLDLIIDSSNAQEPVLDYFPGDNLLTPLDRPKGLPIGNLTSQSFANIYLNGFDWFIKDQLKVKNYLRYVDDFAMFSNDRTFLEEVRQATEIYLSTLRLKLHPIKTQLFETRIGANFVGFRILRDRIRVRAENLHRARRRIRRLQQDYANGKIDLETIEKSLQSWRSHLRHGDTHRLQEDIFTTLRFEP
jgi:RNA-directed DNA polymerase